MKFPIGEFIYSTKLEAKQDYSRILNCGRINYADCKKVLSLASYNPAFLAQFGKNSRNILDIYTEKKRFIIETKYGIKMCFGYGVLIDLAYAEHKAIKDNLAKNGYRYFKQCCKTSVEHLLPYTRFDEKIVFVNEHGFSGIVKEFIKITKIDVYKEDLVRFKDNIFYFLDNRLERKFQDFFVARAQIVIEKPEPRKRMCKSIKLLKKMCRFSIGKYAPKKNGYEAHHANEGGFAKIFDDFIEKYQIKYNEVEILTYASGMSKFADSEFEKLFVDFHNEKVKWKLVTPEEHLLIHSVNYM